MPLGPSLRKSSDAPTISGDDCWNRMSRCGRWDRWDGWERSGGTRWLTVGTEADETFSFMIRISFIIDAFLIYH